MSLAKALTGVLTRSLEAAGSSTHSANKMLKEVVPFLLSPSGLESSAKEVQAFALLTLLQIIKSSNGRTLRPFVPSLINHLLALLSSLEPAEVNYIHLNAGQYDLTTQQIDDARLNSVRGSPMMEAIERCLDILDEETMAVLCPSLEIAIKTAIGLPSKVGSTRVLVSLSTRHNYIFKKYADQFLRLVRKQVLDRNETVSSSYAVGCGYLARLASEGEILNLVRYCQGLYFDSDDDRHRSVSGDIIYAFSKNATDRFNSIASDILPFVFLAKHDASERVKDFFQDTWNENVGGSHAVLLYLKDIINLGSRYLDSPRWSVKHTSALAIADVISPSGSEISDSNARMIWPALEKAAGGKTWEGKEIILQSLVRFVKTSNILSLDEGIAKQIQVRACGNVRYTMRNCHYVAKSPCQLPIRGVSSAHRKHRLSFYEKVKETIQVIVDMPWSAWEILWSYSVRLICFHKYTRSLSQSSYKRWILPTRWTLTHRRKTFPPDCCKILQSTLA